MLDESLLELIVEENYGLNKHWQWLFKIDGSPLWSITNIFMTKEMFIKYVEEHNQICPRHKITEFGKAKITKRFFEPSS